MFLCCGTPIFFSKDHISNLTFNLSKSSLLGSLLMSLHGGQWFPLNKKAPDECVETQWRIQQLLYLYNSFIMKILETKDTQGIWNSAAKMTNLESASLFCKKCANPFNSRSFCSQPTRLRLEHKRPRSSNSIDLTFRAHACIYQHRYINAIAWMSLFINEWPLRRNKMTSIWYY